MFNRIFKIFVLALALTGLAACIHQDPTDLNLSGKPTGQIYFIKVKNQNYDVKPVLRAINEAGPNNLKELISQLLSGPTEKEIKQNYGSEIPKGTRILAYTELPEKITIDLSGQFVSGGGSRSMILRHKQLTETIASSGTQKPVYILVEGKELKTLGGEGLVSENPIYEGQENQKSGELKEDL
jgi:spore germination protein GerM